MYPMAANRPDWTKVMTGCGGADAEDNGYVTITKGTAKLAMSSIRQIMEMEYYHNYGVAYQEINNLLEGK